MANVNDTINYIELPMSKKAETEAFYKQAFGWSFTDWGPDYISFEGAGIDGGFNRESGVTVSPPGILVILYADSLSVAQANIERAGGTIVRAVYDFPGGQRFHFEDPNGNQLAVWSEPN